MYNAIKFVASSIMTCFGLDTLTVVLGLQVGLAGLGPAVSVY